MQDTSHTLADNTVTSSIRVRFAETDQMGIAHHSAYVCWCEVARVEWFRHHGHSYRAWEASGISLAVSGLELSYKQAAHFDDVLHIQCQLSQLRSRHLRFHYQLYRESVLLARGYTQHTPMNRQGQAVRLPEPWLQLLKALG